MQEPAKPSLEYMYVTSENVTRGLVWFQQQLSSEDNLGEIYRNTILPALVKTPPGKTPPGKPPLGTPPHYTVCHTIPVSQYYMHMRQSWTETKCQSVMYFKCITVSKVLYQRASAKCGIASFWGRPGNAAKCGTHTYSVALVPGSPEREMYTCGEPGIFSHVIMT